MKAFDLCVEKSRRNIRALADEQQPRTWACDPEGHYARRAEDFFDIGNWTSSFFTGMALLAWIETEDEFFLQQVRRLAPLYRAKVFERHADTMHDLGFLYYLYSVALFGLTGDPAQREIGLRAAEVLAGRFVPEGGYIRAWGRMDEQNTEYAGLAIIDCMMNLPLLYWASETSGDAKYGDLANHHADTTLRCFVRPDGSVFHSYRFDVASGQPLRADNYCGRTVDSQWARGTAWAIYGFALAHKYTQHPRYREASQRVARKFIAELGEDAVPAWDFQLPAGEPRVVDSSAAAIAVCGVQELLRQDAADEELAAAKDRMLNGLCTPQYLDANESVPGILRMGQGGDGAGKARSFYTSWGDYYLMEALSQELCGFDGWF